VKESERDQTAPISESVLEDRVLQAAEEAFARVMAGVPEQLATMPPDLDLADAIRWAGDRVTELLAGLSELPLESLLGLDHESGATTPMPDGEPVRVQATAGTVAEARVWVHPVGDLAAGALHFLLSDLVTASGGTIPGSLAGFTPEQIATPVTAGAGTLLRLWVPAGAAAGCYHGHVFAHGVIGAAVPIVVTLT